MGCCGNNKDTVLDKQSDNAKKDDECCGGSSCCGENNDKLRDQVRDKYSDIAKKDDECCGGSNACGDTPKTLGNPGYSERLGYSEEELAAVPDGANMGLGCGNPQAIAEMKPGEVVLDLGSGGGFDCFLAAKQVGSTGQVIGVDMTPEMISKARANAQKSEYDNVEFRLGEIEYLPVADNTVDVIISNCVINLSPTKKQVFKEAHRVLKKGGRLAVSDVVAIAPLPADAFDNVDIHCGCIAGAALVDDLKEMLVEAGFSEVSIDIKKDSNLFISDWFPGTSLEENVRSSIITAIK